MDWFEIGKGVRQGCILLLCLFNFYAEYIMWNARLDESQAEIKIARRNIKLRYADDTTLMAESEDKLKSLLMKVKEESEKAGIKLNFQKMKIMASGPITSWQIKGGKVEQWQIFFSWAPKSLWMVTEAMKLKDTCSLKKKSYKKLRILKNRDNTLPTKVCIVKAMVFPVVMYGFASWTIKKAEHWRIDAFKLCCWRTLLNSPLDCKEIKPINLKEINPEYSLEELILKLQYFGSRCQELTH